MIWPFDRWKKSEPETKQRPIVVKQRFDAAGINRFTAGWTTQCKNPDDLIYENLKILRARSREQYRNNDYMSRFVGLTRSNVVGPKGMTLQAVTKTPNGTLDAADNDNIEKLFSDFCKRGNCDITEQLSFLDVQRLFISTVTLDGEFLAIEHMAGPYGYQLEMVDPETLDLEHNRELKNGHKIIFSIEFNRNKKPIAYYFTSPDGDYTHRGKRYVRMPAASVIHCFVPELIGLKRGIPAAATALMRMNMLDGYEDAAITAARVGASKMGFISTPGGGYTGDGEDVDGATISDVEAGLLESVPEGTQFMPFNPDYPHQQFADFVKTCLRGIGAGLGVSYNTLANDLEGVNFSSIRAGVLEDREAWKALQEWMISSFNSRVYERWMLSVLKLRMLPGAPGPEKFPKFKEHTWLPRRWAWVDPMKDAQANELEIASGIRSRSEVIRERGRDPDEVWQELARENKKLRELGLNPSNLNMEDSDNEEPEEIPE